MSVNRLIFQIQQEAILATRVQDMAAMVAMADFLTTVLLRTAYRLRFPSFEVAAKNADVSDDAVGSVVALVDVADAGSAAVVLEVIVVSADVAVVVANVSVGTLPVHRFRRTNMVRWAFFLSPWFFHGRHSRPSLCYISPVVRFAFSPLRKSMIVVGRR